MSQRLDLKPHERMGIQCAINARLKAKRELRASAAWRASAEADVALDAIVKATLESYEIPGELAELERDKRGRFTGSVVWQTADQIKRADPVDEDPSDVSGLEPRQTEPEGAVA